MSHKGKQLHAWAETTPWDCLSATVFCASETHDHSPMVGDPCELCRKLFQVNDRAFSVIEVPAGEKHPRWVCSDHVAGCHP